MFFAYGGFETVGVVAGEANDPARHLPFAFMWTIVAVTLIMSALQTISTASLPDIAKSSTPIADSAKVLLGWSGAALVGLGSVISMLGNNIGSSLSASRTLFAIAENGDVPAFLARIHPRYRTPANAIWFSTALALLLAVTGSFAMLAVVSAVARLVPYVAVSAATLALRRPGFPPATFLLPLGPAIPVVATLISLAIFAGATGPQLAGGAAALGAGAVLYFCNGWVVSRGARNSMTRR
jgi:amino acid transporter